MLLFSIIIPTYNRAHMLPKTIQSVINQTFLDWELIIVDDGSTDGTRELIKHFIEKESRIKYIYQNNSERSVARNNGIKNALGRYICFLDSDDWYAENHLQVLSENITNKTNPIGLFFTNYNEVSNNQIKNISPPNFEDFNNPIDYLMSYAIIPARVCVHNEILKKNKFDEDITIIEDVILWTRIELEYPVYHIQEHTVNYLIHEDNSINIKGKGAIKRYNGLLIFFKRYPDIVKLISKKQKNQIMSDTLFNISKHYIYHSKSLKAVKYLIKSILISPYHPQTKHKFFCAVKIITRNKIPEYQPNRT
jgi:glycosyltransferase involved in cell wall biosynthesis